MRSTLRGMALGALCALVVALVSASPVAAQPFDIKEPDFKKGETTLGSINGVQGTLRQAPGDAPTGAYELEAGYGVTDWLKITGHVHLENAYRSHLRATHVTLESLVKFRGTDQGGFGLAWFTAIEGGTTQDATNRVFFGPIAQIAAGPWRFTLNPIFEQTFGRNREDGIALVYGWQSKLEVQKGVSIALEGFGHIPDLGNAPSVAEQEHRIGPALYLETEIAKDRTVTVSLGVLAGLTRATPDHALKFNVGLAY
ncbi:MAG: hypothetical protein R3D31_01570 [Hyphomicrobiaceae bacterium]